MIIEIIIGTTCFIIGGAIGMAKSQRELVKLEDELKEKDKITKYWFSKYESTLDDYFDSREESSRYRQAYREILNSKQNQSGFTPDVCEAIKFAMVNSHPDKPAGNQEKFVKFHQLYKKYCR